MSNQITLYQHGTLALLVPGLLTGTITMAELLKHGDTGIGTGEGLDGELIILDGKPYHVHGTGDITIAPDSFTMPFANAHFARYSPLAELENVDEADLNQQMISLSRARNTFFSVEVHGVFSNVQTRAAVKSNPPYNTLAETAENQSVFNRDQVKGTLVGYYSPELFEGATVGGFHHHFISDDHQFGGHVLSFHLDKGDVSYQLFDTFEQHLPVGNKQYMEHDFSNDDIAGGIHQSE
ncbi:acetolactate decarboxylase [Lentilactobacillus otakiensis]|jgi:acetolactate decarboxylase|uniref:Alpha-acetolactate decarboxylase n=1 Tax=Lentilactobacillus otakiensis DSM 19908 = JCM 15040 TaxID=1423780 RepID=S4NT68_9LACO|nr:acetolactate decarboxylase [Lentilactobacillus otakiensis]KRL12099.1 alpha-acetolactate decarboxylase [Lentilactobacillus otakiensis DSM 19908 = JCM 15040]MBZ3777546.1 acetolactate decarboxylase [Lentilactobacillus otakiensis]MDV3517441.1 acetolactate decarboxylase [Lentilactobacillus otakiensis]GAD17143.1 acetolactate decarboxylase [Lentilactobacillus otakiensis DSM 19908 = JCM 15040]